MKRIIVYLMIMAMPIFAQTEYELTPGSKGNQILLSVINDSKTETINRAIVKVTKEPADIMIQNCTVEILELSAGEEKEVMFSFEVKENPTKLKDTIRFTINTDGETKYQKEIIFKYALPAEYSLEQNYPNPFNPETVIRYNIQATSQVTLKVYDVLGNEVTTLVNEIKQAGSYNYKFSIINYKLSSSVYFYRLTAINQNGANQVFTSTKKMMLVK